MGPYLVSGEDTATRQCLSSLHLPRALMFRSTIIVLEIFGSPFMRNASVILALLFGYFIAAVTNYQGKKYVITTKIDQAPGITFLWTTTFPLGGL